MRIPSELAGVNSRGDPSSPFCQEISYAQGTVKMGRETRHATVKDARPVTKAELVGSVFSKSAPNGLSGRVISTRGPLSRLSVAAARHHPPQVDALLCAPPLGRGKTTGSKSIHEV